MENNKGKNKNYGAIDECSVPSGIFSKESDNEVQCYFEQEEKKNSLLEMQSKEHRPKVKKFMISNAFALFFGLFIGGALRLFLNSLAKEDKDTAMYHHYNGTEMKLTDLLGCIAMMIIAILLFDSRGDKWYSRRNCSNPIVVLRHTFRNGIPILFGVGVMFLLKFVSEETPMTDYQLSGPGGGRIIEMSDVIGGIVLLSLFHLIDHAFEKCLPRNPRNYISLFETSSTTNVAKIIDIESQASTSEAASTSSLRR